MEKKMSNFVGDITIGPVHPVPNVLGPRQVGTVNWRGLWTLYVREVHRFLKIIGQTILAPVLTALLFLAVFSLAFSDTGRSVGNVAFTTFLAPGLIMMVMLQNAFGNTSTSLVMGKVLGTIVDILMPPLNACELTIAYALSGMTRGLMVGAAAGLAMWVFVPLPLENFWLVLYHAFSASLMLSLLGTMAGLWAEKFDHIAAATNFVIMPASFLSGTFYSIERLPEYLQLVVHFNPFFYLIDGFRSGFIGDADANSFLGVLVVLAVNAVLAAVLYRLFASGYKLKT